MKKFISNSTENLERRLWKCSNSGLGCKLFIWDIELERNTSTESKNSIECNCLEVVQELSCIIKDIEAMKKKLKLKLENDRKKFKLFKLLLTLLMVYVLCLPEIIMSFMFMVSIIFFSLF